MGIYDQEPEETFCVLFIHTLGHLTRSVLQIHELHGATEISSLLLTRSSGRTHGSTYTRILPGRPLR